MRLPFSFPWTWVVIGTHRLADVRVGTFCVCSFSASVARLFELGVPTQQFVTAEPWVLKNTDEKN